MKLHLRNFAGLTLVLGLALAISTGCGSDNKPGICGEITFSKENAVTIRMEAAVTSLNPILPGAGYNRYAAANIFQSLGVVEPENLEMKPLLIKKIPEAYTVAEGPYAGSLAFDFEIYDEATWDNGSPVTAQDFLFSLKIIYHPSLPLGDWLGYFEYLQAVETDPANPKKFTAYFSKYYILALETLCQFPIYPAYNYDPDGVLAKVPLADFQNQKKAQLLVNSTPALKAWAEAFQSPRFANDKTAVSGSGPYRLESIDVDQGLVLVKKQNWWGDKLVKSNRYLLAAPDKINYRFVKDDAPTEDLIRNSAVDVVPALSAVKFLELKADTCLRLRYDFELLKGNAYGRILINHRNPILADKAVRQAMAHSIDYDYLINSVLQGMAERCTNPVHPAKVFYARDITPYPYDVEKARSLLAAAGWSDSNGNGILDKKINGTLRELQFTLLVSGASVSSSQTAKSFQTTARSAGIGINVVEEDIRVISEKTRQGDYDLAITGSSLYPGLLDMYQIYHTQSIGGGNRFNFSNPELDRLIEAIRTEPDEAKRNALYIQAQHLVHEELPEIFLYVQQQRMVVNRRFDYVLSPNRPGYYEQYFTLKKQSN